ncbi:MAG: signal peptidase II [Ruminococcaceae bacterium]|nr:signal peptidase II [Oscillospiraceae bacterium]
MVLALILAVVFIIIDQVSKYLIASNMKLGESTTIIPGILDFTYTHNDGMAFGIGSEAFRWIFIFITLVVCAILVYLMFKKDFNHKLYFMAVSCIVSGGIGNLIDRLFNGYVVDFLALSFFPPICNFADYCITAGTIMLVVYILFYFNTKPQKQKN